MPDYGKLRDLVSHRVEFEYDTGARIVGYVASCLPPEGTVQLMTLTHVDYVAADGTSLRRVDEAAVVPNVLTGVRRVEGPAGRDD